MENEMIIKNEIFIHAPFTSVWDALTNPKQTKKYMYGCEAISDWKIGSPLIWKGVWEGKEVVAVKGTIIDIQPGNFLAYTTFDPNNTTMEDIPENYLTVTYTLENTKSEDDCQTLLIVTQGDYAKVADGEKRYNDAATAGGWDSILQQIKKLVEGS